MSALCAGGIVRHGASCYTARRICAALRAAMTAKNFRTRAAAKRRGISFAPQKYFFMQSAQGIPTQGFQNHIPARGRKLRHSSAGAHCQSAFQNHIPARGRKHCLGNLILKFYVISKPHPRKGTETPITRPSELKDPDFKTTSPQGDGNCGDTHFPCLWIFQFQNHIPARGRKRPPCDKCGTP